MARNMNIELLPFSPILYQSRNCGDRIHVLIMMYDVYWYCQMEKNEWLWKFWKRNDYENFEKRGRRKRNPCPMHLWLKHLSNEDLCKQKAHDIEKWQPEDPNFCGRRKQNLTKLWSCKRDNFDQVFDENFDHVNKKVHAINLLYMNCILVILYFLK